MLVVAFQREGHVIRVDPERLSPAEGYWRTDFRADVYRWEGSVEVWRHGKWVTVSVDSWSTMSDCIRGFSVEWCSSYQVEINAIDDRVHPAALRAKAARA